MDKNKFKLAIFTFELRNVISITMLINFIFTVICITQYMIHTLLKSIQLTIQNCFSHEMNLVQAKIFHFYIY